MSKMGNKDNQNQAEMNLGISNNEEKVSEKQEVPVSTEENNEEKV